MRWVFTGAQSPTHSRLESSCKINPYQEKESSQQLAQCLTPLVWLLFNLVGTRIVQKLCHDGVAWDDKVPDNVRP